MAEEKSFNLEQALSQLEELTQKMETGNLSLEESLKLYEHGVKLARQSRNVLEEAEQKVKLLAEGQSPE